MPDMDDILDEALDDNKEKREITMDRVKKNILLAKKYMVESIYRSANVEGLGFTFPETQSICDGMSIAGHPIENIEAVVDLKRAWQWVFENYQNLPDLEMLKTLNRISGRNTVINAGSLRDIYDEPIRVTLGNGEYYYPDVPDKDKVEATLKQLLENEDKTDAAFDIFCYVAKLQAFNDGNKRTATLMANVVLIQHGQGIVSVPEEKTKEFYDCLIAYYKTDEKKELKDFLKNICFTPLTR